jgi:phage terminase large subunit
VAEVITIPYKPRDLQLRIHEQIDEKRFGAVVCHRRFGKTVLAINQLIKAALTCDRDRPRFGYIAPTFAQGKAVAWDYLKHYTSVVPGRVVNESELRLTLPNSSQIRIYGADNPDSLRGLYFDGAVLDEFGMMKGQTWSQVVRPALADREGWALFIGTPNGRNAFFEICEQAKSQPGWFFQEFKASQTGILPEEELQAARSQMSEDEYEQEFEASFTASVRGAIYAKELASARNDERIRNVPYDPVLPVHTAWDLGVGDSTAIWFAQQVGSELRLIDYHEASGEGLHYYAGVLGNKGYTYGRHLAPHDAAVRELGTGKSRVEIAQSLGIRFEVMPPSKLEDGINAARMTFPRCYFDETKCRAGLEALQNYRWDFNQRLDEFKPTPVHDIWSHGADAFRYLCLGLKQQAKPKDIQYKFFNVA